MAARRQAGGAGSGAQRGRRPQAVVVMGVSGAGKTQVGRRLATRLGFAFADADDYHPRANIDKMAAGVPLDDDDRQPWLERLRELIEERARDGGSLVLACSALKERYRLVLSRAEPAAHVTFVYLKGDAATILRRMRRRRGHYMKASMLESQLRDLEEPRGAITVDVVRNDLPASVRLALAGLTQRGVRAAPRSPARDLEPQDPKPGDLKEDPP